MNHADTVLSGWGRALDSPSYATRPAHMAEALHIAAHITNPAGLVFHGAGRSYGDCALNRDGVALITTRLDRILAFDPATSIVEVEPGVTFRQLLAAFLPRGYLVPVTPGTGFATIGGAVANDVHGKNHERAGSFAQHVTELDLVTPDGTTRTISPQSAPELFRATAGGLGLTGLITRVAFRMMAVPGPAVAVRERRVADLDGFLAALRDAAGATYSVGWIDGTARGRALGRGILETAEPAAGVTRSAPSRGRTIPLDFPGFALNPISVAAFNALYYRRVPAAGRSRHAHYGAFLYPLDAIGSWNRIYGKRGFHQFQCVVPYEDGETALRELLELTADSRQASFLAVLKRMGQGRAGYLSFPQPGYTLALDFPRKPGVEALYAQLCAIARRFGGRVYLGKDALLDAASFRAMYPELALFQAVLDEFDPKALLQSDMSRRLRLRDGRAVAGEGSASF